jgi:hypothetical protein
MAEDTLSHTEGAVSVAKAKVVNNKAVVSVVIVTNLQKTETLVAVAGRAPYAEALVSAGITAAFLATLTTDIAHCRSLLGLAVADSTAGPTLTQTEGDAKENLLTLIQRVQSTALLESSGRPVTGWYIGTNLSVESRGMLETIAVALADRLDTHTPPGLPADVATQMRAALAALQTANSNQGATLTTAKQKRAAAKTLYEDINDRRFKILLAADIAYPSRIKTNATIRADFGLPKTRPYRPKR